MLTSSANGSSAGATLPVPSSRSSRNLRRSEQARQVEKNHCSPSVPHVVQMNER